MRDPLSMHGPPARHHARDDQPGARTQPPPHDDGLEEEEKLLAGRLDVNMPALLTRDVKGG